MSDLICGERFWTSMDNAPVQYPWLSSDENCDVLIIGGGITGALAAYRFSKANINTILISKSPIGYIGTSISNGIIDYSVEHLWRDILNNLGKQNTLKYYNMCLESVLNIEDIVNSLNIDVKFNKLNSILYSNIKNNKDKIYTEFLYRKNNGFDIEYIDKIKSRDNISFNLESGIISKNTSAIINPYLFCHGLIDHSKSNGARIYENTSAYKIDYDKSILNISTNTRKTITAKKIIMATGYDNDNYLNIFRNNKVVFTAITNQIDNFSGYKEKDIIYNIDDNFTLIRATSDNRIIISGTDNKFLGFDNRVSKYIKYDKFMNNKINEFENKLNLMFCGINDISIGYKSAMILPQTSDGLPVIGEDKRYPNIYFNYVSGYNGIVQAEFASRLLLSAYKGEVNEDIYMFYPDRNTL